MASYANEMPDVPDARPTWQQDVRSLREFESLLRPLLAGFREPPIVTPTLVGAQRSPQVHIYPWTESAAQEIRERLGGRNIRIVEGRPPRTGQITWPDTEPDSRPPFEISGIAQALLFRDGFWERLNAEADSTFDEFEGCEIPPETAVRARAFIGRYVAGYIRRRPDEGDVPEALLGLANYLAAASMARATLWAEL